MLTKPASTYIQPDADFKPLSKYGHLSRPTAEFAAAESAIDASYSQLWTLSEWAAFREGAGDADAAMPPNGPDRYRDVTTELLNFPARDGEMIELKVYKSPNVLRSATLMYRMHGGGWVVGRHEVDGVENVYAATNPGIIVVSVDYRKAPEHPFPQAIYDSYDGLLWCKKNAKLLGINPEKIILSGSSAGANLAAALALEARDNLVSGICAQVLHFPSLCHPKFFPADKYEFGSYFQNYSNCVLGTLKMESFLDAYMPDPQPDHRLSPLLAASLQGLPPTRLSAIFPVIQCAGVDILRDDAFAFAEAPKASGVKVEICCYPGVPHCFPAILTTISETYKFYETYCKFLRRHSGGRG